MKLCTGDAIFVAGVVCMCARECEPACVNVCLCVIKTVAYVRQDIQI